MKRLFICVFLYFIITNASFAEITLPKIFADGMVLQRDVAVPIWGLAEAGEKVTVTFLGKRYTSKADKNGKWAIKLAEMKAGGAFEMTVKGKNIITIKNILIGEVWICSGQSNMEWKIDWLPIKNIEIAAANFPQIRMFTVPKTVSSKPQYDISGGDWKEAIGENVKDFSAVAYFFGKDLFQQYKVPIGLINTSWGGTIAETWMSAGAAKQIPDFKAAVEELEKNPNISEQANKKAEEARKRIESMGNIASSQTGIEGKWWKDDLNTVDWREMKLPTLWEDVGMEGLDGIVWFRKDFDLPEKYVGKDLVLNLGKIDDKDETYLNGEQIGQTLLYSDERIYKIEGKKFKKGKNTITIRVTDTGGGGGIYGKAEDMFIGLGSERITELAGNWKYKIDFAEKVSVSTNINPNSHPTLLYNSMIHPLIPYAIRGAIWYQGESNAARAYQYRTVFADMIKDWRKQWAQGSSAQGDFPFLFVQLANFMKFEDEPKESDWAELREAQTMTLALPNTGMAVIIDIGEGADIHPKNKYDVGKRLALAAKKIAYKENINYSSPMYESMQINENKATISFKHIGGGLMVKDRYGYLKGFAVAGEDKKFYWAKAYLEGNKVVVYSENVSKPLAVRYAWANNPEDVNLFSKDGLPVCPFRTDDWQGMTVGKK